MLRLSIAIAALLSIGLLTLWLTGGFDQMAIWAAEQQRDIQNTMAGILRQLRAGEPGATIALLSVCFAYGFFHAIGPGHGKILIGGYGAARQVTAVRLSVLALLSSLAQAATAVLLVYAGVLVLGWSRQYMQDIADNIMAPASYGAIVLIGLWLLWRGASRLRNQLQLDRQQHHHDHHDHHHDHEESCGCGHKHAPTVAEAEKVKSVKDAVLLIGTIAIRPCTGALFLLILTWRIGIEGAGIAGAFTMGLGTASVTIMVAIASVTMRTGFLASMGSSPVAAKAVPVIELLVGGIVAVVAVNLLIRTI
ncbi:nickel/cobalt transporter [Pseudaestuariivita rosea]|uniref:nickel/cobalt transporter n=1 Tax=Pseudaestuariivita rosea TaxID=2763263 RepID=UPI001ABA8390|nr:hypothetical protein [Pseudaestuariivita rosea]